jgi:kynurenine formamidase
MSAQPAARLAIITSLALLGASLIGWAQRDGGRPRPASPPWSGYRIVDLTHTLGPESPIYPGGEPLRLTKMADIKDGYYMNKLSCGEHTGTHVDAPSHFSKGGADVDGLSPEALSGPLAVLDLRRHAERDPDLAVGVDAILAWEREWGRLPAGSFVVANTGWAARWGDPKRYLNADDKGVLHFPGFSAEAAEFLIKQRDVKGLGIDTLSTDVGTSTSFPEHRGMLAAGKIHIENLAGLDALPPAGAYLMACPLKLAGGSGSPVRVFAFVPRDAPPR